MQLKLKNILLLLGILTPFLYYSCKTSETSQNIVVDERTRDEILQSKVDTNPIVLSTPVKLGETTLLANEMASLYCNMKQYENKDMSDEEVSRAYEKLNSKYLLLQGKVNALKEHDRIECDSIFNVSKARCN